MPKVKKVKKVKEEPIIEPLKRARYTDDELYNIASELVASPVYVLDLETTGLDTRHDKITGMGLGTLDHTWYLFCDEAARFMDKLYFRGLISDEKTTLIGQNLLFDLDFLYNNGYVVKNQLWDTKAAAFLIDENRSLHLKDLGKTMFNLEVVKFKEVNWADENMVEKYGKQDIDITRMIYNAYKKQIDDNYPIFYKLYMPLIWTVINAQNNGIKIDTEYLQDIFWELKDDIQELKTQLDAEIVNINHKHGNKIESNDELFNSPKQLREIFFGVLGLEPIHVSKKTNESSTDERTLHALAIRGCTLANLLLRYREKNKLFTTYVQPILAKTDTKTSRLHTTYNPYSTVTGRWNSQKPNLQNIPASTKDEGLIRKAFIAEKDHILIVADYSQIELRLLAHFSKDTLFQLAYTKGLDLHKKTAAAIFHKPESMVTEQERGMGKTINFSVIYGISAFRLAEKFNLPMWTAKKYIDAYFELYKGVTAFRKNTVAECKKNGYVETLFFRKRRLPEIQSISSRAERQAVNAIIQGSAADVLNRAIVMLYQKYINTDLKILLQVHDEIVIEVPKIKADMYIAEIKELMESVVKLSVPLKCSVKACGNWSEK
jgi:DNA polymerase-1